MKIRLLKDCKGNVPKNRRLMGLDLGTKTIGVAVSDTGQSLATPVTTIKRSKFSKDIEALAPIIKEFEIGGYIIGYPLNMDGSEGSRCDATRSFADEMTKHPEIFGRSHNGGPFIALQDERLSTQAVDNFVESRVDIKKKSKRGAKESGLTDMLAAQGILQGALDSF